ncbi:MAG TPA: hypothetical protein VHF25_13040 [Nitriliruptorales bacterium]|nr:hypothetical protein [Nitriliruptorales bacterium]
MPANGAQTPPERRRGRGRTAALLMAPLALSFVVPLVGPLVSLASPVMARSLAPTVWPERRPQAWLGAAAFMAVWLPVLLRLFLPFGLGVFSLIIPSEHWWLLLPLCGPSTSITFVLPSVAALTVYAGGSVASVRRGQTVLWPLAALIGTYTYSVTILLLEATDLGGFIC